MALGEFWPWSWMVAALAILATICVALQNQTRRSSKGKTSLPFIGDTVQFLRGPRGFLLNCFTRCGDSYNVSYMGKRITVVNSPETIKFVLSTAHASFPLA